MESVCLFIFVIYFSILCIFLNDFVLLEKNWDMEKNKSKFKYQKIDFEK